MVSLIHLRGQDAARERLIALLAADRVPHALLLEGPDGVGKGVAARTLAQIVLCTNRPSPETACGTCSSCLKIAAGTHADFTSVEADGRFIKIASIRAMERSLRLRPVEGSRKVVLIEDVHRVTLDGQNALLKTLEEPPGATHLILTTSRVRLLIPTVVSRCPQIRFGPLPGDLVEDLLVAEDGLDPDSARLVAALSHGSLGRARAIEVEALLARRDLVASLDRQLKPGAPRPAAAALTAVQELSSDRQELAETLDVWLAWLRDQLLRIYPGPASIASHDRQGELDELASRGAPEILHRARAVLEARRQLDLPYNLNAQLVAEQLCLTLAGLGRMVPVPA